MCRDKVFCYDSLDPNTTGDFKESQATWQKKQLRGAL